jgi:hypothetical protein
MPSAPVMIRGTEAKRQALEYPVALRPTIEAKRQALEHSAGMYNGLAVLRRTLAGLGTKHPEVLEIVQELEAHNDGLKAFLGEAIELVIYNERRAVDSTTAVRVFGIPELFEMIQLRLGNADIFKVYQTCKSVRDAIEGSPRLMKKLGLRPAIEDGLFSTLTLEVPVVRLSSEYKLRTRSPPIHGGFWDTEAYIVTSVQPIPAGGAPRFGSRIRDMLICQPPVKAMSFDIKCIKPGRRPSASVIREDGITVGALFDCVEKELVDHADCPCAYSSRRVAVVVCRGRRILAAYDPLAAAYTETEGFKFSLPAISEVLR